MKWRRGSINDFKWHCEGKYNDRVLHQISIDDGQIMRCFCHACLNSILRYSRGMRSSCSKFCHGYHFDVIFVIFTQMQFTSNFTKFYRLRDPNLKEEYFAGNFTRSLEINFRKE